jgi:adenylate cyclase
VRKLIAGVLIGAATAALFLGGDLVLRRWGPEGFQPLETTELKTYDWRLARTADPSLARHDIALVEIDEYSLRNLEPNAGRWPWPRAFHSFVINFLSRAPAKVIAYDIDFAEADTRSSFTFGGTTYTGEESDRALASAVAGAGTVVLPIQAVFEGDAIGSPPAVPDTGFRLDPAMLLRRRVVFPPFKALADATTTFGHNLLVLDRDGPLRHSVPFVHNGQQAIPSFGLAAAFKAEGAPTETVRIEGDILRVGDRSIPLSTRSVRSADGRQTYVRAPINFRGPALLDDLKSRPYPHYAFFDLLYAEQQILANEKPNIDPSAFKDKIVFVGTTAAGVRDVFETPFGGAAMPGIQVHAAVADDFLSNRFVVPAGTAAHVTTVVVASLVVGIVAVMIPVWWAGLVTAIVLAILVWGTARLLAGGYWLNMSQPVLAVSLAQFGGVAYQYFVEGREKRKIRRLFGQYVSPDVCAQLVADPSQARLGGQRREMTVLFSDIRGFTTVSERGRPEDVVRMLNEYFTRMVEVVLRHGGTIDKFVGDMVMAFFGAPLADDNHAAHAVAAALDMTAELEKLNRQWAAEGRMGGLDIGIGINTGPMIVGNIGSETIMSYTVIGDAVNLGSRLESLNKQYGTRIIISGETRRQLDGRLDRRYDTRPLGNVVVKGKTESVDIYEVVAN